MSFAIPELKKVKRAQEWVELMGIALPDSRFRYTVTKPWLTDASEISTRKVFIKSAPQLRFHSFSSPLSSTFLLYSQS
ncbi:predicted protein [Botrytis cinerea T4]|uniref:Uncharacterized protein n=1 Tax=Botryotinia fuckeliana (strain T4) TaxID=999810 RepID=G2XTZ2_BOTF4|nr:predicted protein [Botrytis cinerea T4]